MHSSGDGLASLLLILRAPMYPYSLVHVLLALRSCETPGPVWHPQLLEACFHWSQFGRSAGYPCRHLGRGDMGAPEKRTLELDGTPLRSLFLLERVQGPTLPTCDGHPHQAEGWARTPDAVVAFGAPRLADQALSTPPSW